MTERRIGYCYFFLPLVLFSAIFLLSASYLTSSPLPPSRDELLVAMNETVFALMRSRSGWAQCVGGGATVSVEEMKAALRHSALLLSSGSTEIVLTDSPDSLMAVEGGYFSLISDKPLWCQLKNYPMAHPFFTALLAFLILLPATLIYLDNKLKKREALRRSSRLAKSAPKPLPRKNTAQLGTKRYVVTTPNH